MQFLNQMMGQGEQTDENQDVEHESGMSRMGSAICCALFSPFLMLACVIVIGWNEKRAVCDSKAIYAGRDVVLEVGCGDAGSNKGELVLWTCKLDDPATSQTAPGTAFSTVSHLGYCLNSNAEMRQCIEKTTSTSKKDSVGGGKTTVKTYDYSRQWSKTFVDSSNFKKRTGTSFINNCGSGWNNQPWPADFPTNGVTYAESAKAQSWTLTKSDLQSVLDCNAEPVGATATATGYTRPGAGTTFFSTTPNGQAEELGSRRVTFTGDKKNTEVTALGQNDDGTMGSWTAPDSWLCSGYSIKSMKSGALTKDALFEHLISSNTGVTWILRIVMWLLLWASCTCMGRPLEVAADCIPCIGPFLGDMIDAVVCCVTCFPSLACCGIVAGCVWVAMRPAVGAPILIIGLCIVCGSVGYKFKRDQDKKAEGDDGEKPQATMMGQGGGGGGGDYCGPVAPNVAADFIKTLRVEYIGMAQDVQFGNVGDFFAAYPDAEGALTQYEDRVRDSGDRMEEVQAIQREWNLNATE
jgi:hypothetical protein